MSHTIEMRCFFVRAAAAVGLSHQFGLPVFKHSGRFYCTFGFTYKISGVETVFWSIPVLILSGPTSMALWSCQAPVQVVLGEESLEFQWL